MKLELTTEETKFLDNRELSISGHVEVVFGKQNLYSYQVRIYRDSNLIVSVDLKNSDTCTMYSATMRTAIETAIVLLKKQLEFKVGDFVVALTDTGFLSYSSKNNEELVKSGTISKITEEDTAYYNLFPSNYRLATSYEIARYKLQQLNNDLDFLNENDLSYLTAKLSDYQKRVDDFKTKYEPGSVWLLMPNWSEIFECFISKKSHFDQYRLRYTSNLAHYVDRDFTLKELIEFIASQKGKFVEKSA